jgi:hypothetical protein
VVRVDYKCFADSEACNFNLEPTRKKECSACSVRNMLDRQASDVPQWPPVEGGHCAECCKRSAYVSNAPLGLSFNGGLWLRRQLQNRRLLALTQCRQERDPAIRKFQCIVMRRDLVFVDLSKDRCLMVDYFIAPGYQARR